MLEALLRRVHRIIGSDNLAAEVEAVLNASPHTIGER